MLSKNGVALVLFVFSWLGLEVTEEGLIAFISAVLVAYSFVMMLWNQLQRKDVKFFFFKK